MVVNVGINGFGRIGRIIFRTILQNNDLEISAINDPAVDIDYICYLIKFDSTHGKLQKDITFTENEVTVDGMKIKVFHEKFPTSIPWETADVHYVVEASGMFTNLDKASGHLIRKSVKRVILTAPSVDIPMMILGVNEDKIATEHKVISCASSTLYCLAPLIKILEFNYGVVEGFVTSIHAMTPSLKPLDGLCLRGKHWRDHRSIHQNIIPAATGACKALGKIIPQVKDKMTGLAFRVPIVNVSVLDVTVRLNKNTTLEDIIKHVENASKKTMKNIIKTSSDEAVSSDFMGDSNSCILDINSSLQLTPNFLKLICWYENEYSYACRVVDLIMYSEKCFTLDLMFKLQNAYKFTSTYCRRPIVCLGNQMGLKSRGINRAKAKLVVSKDNDLDIKLPTQEVNTKLRCGNSEPDNPIYKLMIESDTFNPEVKGNVNSFFHNYLVFNPSKKCDTKIITNLENRKKEYTKEKDEITITERTIKPTIYHRPMSGDNLYGRSNKYNILESRSMIIEDKNHTNVAFNYQIKEFNDAQDKENLNYNFKENPVDCVNISKTLDLKKHTEGIHALESNELEKNKLNFTRSDNADNIKINILQIQNSDDTTNHVTNNNEIDNICPQNYVNYNIYDETDNEMSTNNTFKEDKKEIEKYFNKINKTDINKQVNYDLKCDKDITETRMDVALKLDSKIIENDNRQDSAILNSDELSISPVTTTTTASNGDIYDKLDSASASDSNNSFQIHERKSQIIKINDLTASLDDLDRLEKICKIIEISDDLSDRLFSALNNKSVDLKENTWSFKDLCERLNIDDFYNKVFGQIQKDV